MALSRRQWRFIDRFLEAALSLPLRDWDAQLVADLHARYEEDGVDCRITNLQWEQIRRIKEEYYLG